MLLPLELIVNVGLTSINDWKNMINIPIVARWSLLNQLIIRKHFTIKFMEKSKIEFKLNNKLHRENDKPAIICPNGTKYWYQNDKRHRTDGPAVIWCDGEEEWWENNVKIK